MGFIFVGFQLIFLRGREKLGPVGANLVVIIYFVNNSSFAKETPLSVQFLYISLLFFNHIEAIN